MAGREPVRDLDDLAFAVAENEQVGFRVEQDRAANLFLPVIVVRDAAQARLDAADLLEGDAARQGMAGQTRDGQLTLNRR